MDTVSSSMGMVMTVLSLGRIMLGIYLFSAPLSLRRGGWLRLLGAFAALFFVFMVVAAATMLPVASQERAWFFYAQFITYSFLLLACVGMFVWTFDANIWTALFCCSAGYTVQNLASGATELVWSLLGGDPPLSPGFYSLERLAVSFCCTFVVFGLFAITITRHLSEDSLRRIEDRSMLAMMALTILVIIGFDLLVKSLVERGVPTPTMVLLRIFHGLACIFTLVMEYHLLIRRRLEAERDTAWHILAERERQYEMSRENVDAINARVHDIRHAIGRMADKAHLDRDLLADIIREIDVYGPSLRTGNVALDTLLSERGLAFQQQGISFTCVADGTLFSFMEPRDTYALFSTLIDEAAARTEALPDGRSISMSIREALGSVAIHVECTEVPTAEGDSRRLHALAPLCETYGTTFTSLSHDGVWHANMLFPPTN